MKIVAKNLRAVIVLKGLYSKPLQQLSGALNSSEIKTILIGTSLLTIAVISAISLSFRIAPQVYDLFDGNKVVVSNTKVTELVSDYLAEAKETSGKATIENSLEAKKLNDVGNTYSFKYTSLGFYLKSLKFINESSREEAEKQILESIPKSLRARANQYVRAVLLLSEKYQVDPIWVLSVMWTESHFKATSKSHVGAAGLMQVMPRTRRYTYRKMKRAGKRLVVEDVDFNISKYFDYQISKNKYKKHVRKLVNIEIGIVYLKGLLKTFNYNHKLATVAYNMGPGWTRGRLRRNLPVGNDNRYLRKVKKAYKYMVRRI